MVRTARVGIRRTAAGARGAGAVRHGGAAERPAPGPPGLTSASRVADRAAAGRRRANRPDASRADDRPDRPPRVLDDRRGRRAHSPWRLVARPQGRSVATGSTVRSRAGHGGRGCRRPTPRRLAGPDPDRPPRHLLGATSRGRSGWSPRVHPPGAAGAYAAGQAHSGVGWPGRVLSWLRRRWPCPGGPVRPAAPSGRCDQRFGTRSRTSCGAVPRRGDDDSDGPE